MTACPEAYDETISKMLAICILWDFEWFQHWLKQFSPHFLYLAKKQMAWKTKVFEMIIRDG